MPDPPPHPFVYAHKAEFLALPRDEQPPHIWECLQYLDWRRGVGDVPEDEMDRQVSIVRHLASDIARHTADRLREEGAYENRFDPRWPRFHPNSTAPLYLIGGYPPLFNCLPDDEFKSVSEYLGSEYGDEHLNELVVWLQTPAGRFHSIDDGLLSNLQTFAVDYGEKCVAVRKSEQEVRRTGAELHQAMAEMNAIGESIKKRTQKP